MTAGLVSLPIARATLRERARGFLPVALTVLYVLMAASNAAQLRSGAEAFSGFARMFLVVLAMALGAGLISDEIDSGHAQLVMLRPITRASWYGGRLLGASAAFALASVVAWLCAGAVALSRGGALDLGWVATLLTVLIEGLAWMSVLAMLSVLVRGWMNIGIVILTALTYFFLTFTLPLALGRPALIDTFRALGSYIGPQGLGDTLRAVRHHAPPPLRELFYDLLWIFGPWLCGVLLLNRRELARRRR